MFRSVGILVAVCALLAASFTSKLPAPPASRGYVLVANKGEHTLGIIDPESSKQIAVVTESGVTGHEVAGSPDGALAFIPIYGDSGVGLPGTDGNSIDVIDLARYAIIHTIDFGKGVRPHCAVFGPKDGLLYVTTELLQSVTIIDPHSFKVVGSVPTGSAESHMLAISPDGKFGYTANVGPGTVSVLDLVARKTIAVIPVTAHIQRISVSADGKWVFTSDTAKPRVAVISTATNKLDRWVELPGHGYGSASTPDGKMLLIAVPDANAVAVIDLKAFQVAKTVSVPALPQEIIIRPDGAAAYASCEGANQVAEINLGDWSVKAIDTGKAADGLSWAEHRDIQF